MVLDIFISIFTEVIKETIMEFVVVPIKRLISYPFTYKSNVEKLRHEAEELKNRTDKLQQAVEEATRKGKEIYESVNTLAKQVHRKAIEENLFDVVAMVAVNQTPELRRIQSEIADILGLKFDVGEIPGRANRLYERLKKEKKVLIVLDDIWEKLDLNAVGIPFGDGFKGCKILLTSRSQDVLSREVGTQKEFRLDVPQDEEARSLFEMTVSSAKNSEFLPIAAEIAKKYV